MDAILIFFLLIVSSIIFSFFFVKPKPKTPKSLNLPPGPPKLPLIGNLHQLAGALPHRAFRDLAKKHGPIMHIQLGQMSTIVVSSPQLAKDVFKTHDLALASRPRSLASQITLYGNTDIAFGPYGEYWRQLKKICLLQLLSAKKVRSFGAIRLQEFNRFMKFIDSLKGEVTIDIHEKVSEMTNNVVSISSFGNNCRQQCRLIEFIHVMGREMSGLNLGDLFPEYEFVSAITGRTSKLWKIRKTFDEIMDEIFEDLRGRTSDGEIHEDESLLQVLLRIKTEGGLEFPITNDNIKAILVDIFIGGTDTTSITIEWAMTEMMRNPRVMEKAQTEVREAFKGKTTIIDVELHGLSYIHNVVKETLRLHPPLPLLLPHECREPCNIGGFDIQVHQKVIINAWACGTDPTYWEDAESFKPERFENTSTDFMGNDFELVPFGAGRRICPGIAFGVRTIEFFIANMLYFYDWKLPHGLTPTDIDMTETEGLFARKKVSLNLIPTHYPLLPNKRATE